MTEIDGGISLTTQQRLVVEQPADARVLVTAGAGAGKTTTLVHRLGHLVDQEDLTGGEILVLTFSDAAVRALRERLDRHGGPARNVRATTFDAWANALLLQSNQNLEGTDYDLRIEMATTVIAGGGVETTEQGFPLHVIIDEVQDLVGVRREMMETLLERFPPQCGFTVVGDVAQFVYGFSIVDSDDRHLEAGRFLTWVRNWFVDEIIEVTLDDNFRARTNEAGAALTFGSRVGALSAIRSRTAAEERAAAIYEELRLVLQKMPAFGNIDDEFVRDSMREFDGSAAILCRTNGDVLRLSELLRQAGVPHGIQRSSRSRRSPSWLYTLLLATEATYLTEDHFLDLAMTLELPAEMEPVRMWRSLRRVAGDRRGQLDLVRLSRAIGERRLPGELTAAPPQTLLISTVHRAKGLEFDRVIVTEPEALSERREEELDPCAEARALYVAMTRPRDELYRIDRPQTWMMRRLSRRGRWYVAGRERWQRLGIEATELDVASDAPAGAKTQSDTPARLQSHLAAQVRPGDRVELVRLHDLPLSPAESPPYGIYHSGQLIGEGSPEFRQDLWRVLKISTTWEIRSWPDRITGLWIDAVQTVIGDAAITRSSCLNDRGVWLAPSLCGLGRFEWNHSTLVLEGQ
ncbi:UvrD-helicase domain-containing protein [Hamadaea sp.]|uniref:UvrD-helicase domain-containing protein n=1 Tax=Hamadaea sp. TaxID=2024425 RepID=UPI0025BBC393|nr:UvrD-helicase domain-containing protein [Hamadaea sp.]